MHQLEVDFFDEYKAVDNICRDMLSADQGGRNISVRWRKLIFMAV